MHLRGLGWRAVIFVIPFLAACQTATMSVEEARKVTASFSEIAFVPPPRTIEDIVQMLDRQKRDPNMTASTAAARHYDEIPPPETTDAWRLGRFYHGQRSAPEG